MIDRDPYVTIEQAMALTGLSIRTIYDRIEDALFAVKPGEQKSANGRPQSLIRLASLSEDAQLKYWQRELTSPVEAGPSINLAEVPESARVEALRRLTIVLSAERMLADRRGDVTAFVSALARQHKVGIRTFQRWLADYRKDGIHGLVPAWGGLKGRFTALSTALQDLIKSEYLSPQRPSPTTVYRRVVDYCHALRLPRTPSLATVNRFIKLAIPQPAAVLAREGHKAWRVECEPKGHRDWMQSAVNDWWVGDHREMDVFVRESDRPDAKIFRPWLTAWYEPRTRTCVGTHVGTVPNSETIALALRAGILRYGVPRNLYIDNGKDYRCHYLNGHVTVSRQVALSNEITIACAPGALHPLGVGVTHAHTYQAWSKPIEPWFGHTFPVWERTLPGWCGSDNKERPEKLKAEIQGGKLLTLEEFTQALHTRLDEYHRTEHSELGATSLSQWQGIAIEIPDARALDLLLMRHRPVKVTHQGIKLFGSRNHPRFYWHDALWQHQGQTVDVRYDQNDIGRLFVFVQGKFLCEAINDPALRQGATAEDLKTLHKRKSIAYRNSRDYNNQRRLLMSPEQALADIAAERRAHQSPKVVNLIGEPLSLPVPTPQPGTRPLTRVTGFEGAAASIARQTVRRVDAPRLRLTAPATASQRTDTNQDLHELLRTTPAPHRKLRTDDAEREALLREII